MAEFSKPPLMAAAMLMAVVLVLSSIVAESKFMVYNTTAKIVPEKLNVHLVAHTHDDAGWLKTVDQYYVGSNNSIQGACVQNILDSLIPALLADKNRKFIYVEQAFFERWWREQSEGMQDIVKGLVKSGQLEFINGGMVMHDEAATHYIDMIDQTTLGHQFLKNEFGVIPRVGWQIDPFGHSAVQAYLLGAEVGFDSLFFARIDYQDREKRMAEKSLEVVWQGSKSLGATAQIFTGAFWQGNYEPPDGFHFEVNDDSPVVQDDPTLFDYNVQDRVNAFVAAALSQANVTRTNHIMWTMGTDFKYQYAHTWFRQMDKLIHYVNLDGRVNALYSTASMYTDAKYAAQESWPTKTADFFPYADRINAYWTGYFTSRPTLKRYVREMSGYYMAARQLEYFIGRSKSGPNNDALADALAIAQHHDAVTGTEKQHVANDYAKRLSIGYQEAEKVVASSIGCLTQSSPATGCQNPTTKFQQCPLMNISYCPASETNLSHGKKLIVVVYNPLGWKREDIIRIPVKNEDVVVRDSEGREIESQIFPISDVQLGISNFHVAAYLGITVGDAPKYWLAFAASVPPLGFSTYTVTGVKGVKLTKSYVYTSQGDMKFDIGLETLKFTLSEENGKLTYHNKQKSLGKKSVEVSYGFYPGYNGTDKDTQASGAYVFRPNGTYVMQSKGKIGSTVMRGPLIDEVHQQINSWISQITRVYKNKEYVEVEYTVGPIPVEDGFGKEVVAKLSTGMHSNNTFYTDSNGRDFIERIRDYRSDWNLQVNQPVAGNYYPINLGIYLHDDINEFSVLVDRSVGGSSILDGQIELMLHRRLLKDDGRGVAEALNETVCAQDKCMGLIAQGKFYFKIDRLGEGAKWRRSFGQKLYSPLLLAFSEQDDDNWLSSHIPTFSGMDSYYSLPENVAMITLQELDDGKILLRLAHLYEVGEDKDLSSKANVELKRLFPLKKIGKVMETNLSANQEREEMEKKRLVWKSQGSSAQASKVTRGGPIDSAELIVELGPMEIRTLLIEFSHKSDGVFDA
ncbi:probable alpha-mannosidase At5g13980 [Chenopodium quinoa]|uniref:probable alpha-mannosidase At5g13980 n=1 Tax=Chenopodium quinoa TaxID=63459 RepID=UPI000B76D87E|nr:probable alpha-mannosidase At5g13980 [Chenopodium quinoa]